MAACRFRQFICISTVWGLSTLFIIIIYQHHSNQRYSFLHTHNQDIKLWQEETHGWSMYRLGDMVKSMDFRSENRGYNLHKKNYPESIATEYMDRLPQEMRVKTNLTNKKTPRQNISLLMEIMKERANKHPELVPSNSTIVIHLRTGDVIDQNTHSIDEFLITRNVTNWGYTRPLSFYGEILHNITNSNIKFDHIDILLVTGWHKELDHKRSIQYIDHLIKYIENDIGYNVTLRINNNPDDDFILMCHSKYFIKCGGGFSEFIAMIVTNLGGTVFGD